MIEVLLTSATVSVMLTGALVWLSKAWISERLKGAIQHEYDQKIEAYKSELQAQTNVAVERLKASNAQFLALHDTASSALGAIHGIAHERRLRAVEAIWAAVVKIRNQTPAGIALADAFAEKDYDRLFFHTPELRGMIDGVNLDAVKAMASSFGPDGVDSARPFAGEYLFALFEAYRVLSIRVLTITALGLAKGEVPPWYREEWNRTLVANVVGDVEMKRFDESEVKFNFIRVAIESKIIEQSSRTISGEASAAYMLTQGTKILESVRALEARPSASSASLI